jgi:ADP-ribose pyrophosphatase
MIAFRNKKFYIKVEDVKLPSGKTIRFANLIKQPGTNIIPLLDNDTVLLALQYRTAIKKWIYQLAGGRIEGRETPLQNARKELEEELGYRAGKMKLIAKVYTAPHISNDYQYIFIATDLRRTRQHLEQGEWIKIRRIKIKDAIRMVQTGRITDSTTVAGLLMLEKLLAKRKA